MDANQGLGSMRAAFDHLISTPQTSQADSPASPPKLEICENAALKTSETIQNKGLLAANSSGGRPRALSLNLARTDSGRIQAAGQNTTHRAPQLRRSSVVGQLQTHHKTVLLGGQIQKSPLLAFTLGTMLPELGKAGSLPSPDQVSQHIIGGVVGMTHYCGEAIEGVTASYSEVSAQLQECVAGLEDRYSGACAVIQEYQDNVQSLEVALSQTDATDPQHKVLQAQVNAARESFLEKHGDAFEQAKQIVAERVAPMVSTILVQIAPQLGHEHFQAMSSGMDQTIRGEGRLEELLKSQLSGVAEGRALKMGGRNASQTLRGLIADAAVVMSRPGDSTADGQQLVRRATTVLSNISQGLGEAGLDTKTVAEEGKLIREGKKARQPAIQALRPTMQELTPLMQKHKHLMKKARLVEAGRLKQEMKPLEKQRAEIEKQYSAEIAAGSAADARKDALDDKIESFDNAAGDRLAAVIAPCAERISDYFEACFLEGAPMNGNCGPSAPRWPQTCEQLCDAANTNEHSAELNRLLTGGRSPVNPQSLARNIHAQLETGLVIGAHKDAGEDGKRLQHMQYVLDNFDTLMMGMHDRLSGTNLVTDASRPRTSTLEALQGASSETIQAASEHVKAFAKLHPGDMPPFETEKLKTLSRQKQQAQSGAYWRLRDNLTSAGDQVIRTSEDARATRKALQNADESARPALEKTLEGQVQAQKRALEKQEEAEAKFAKASATVERVEAELSAESAHCDAVTQLAQFALICRGKFPTEKLRKL